MKKENQINSFKHIFFKVYCTMFMIIVIMPSLFPEVFPRDSFYRKLVTSFPIIFGVLALGILIDYLLLKKESAIMKKTRGEYLIYFVILAIITIYLYSKI